VKWHNLQIWEREDFQESLEHKRIDPKVNVCAAILEGKVYHLVFSAG
jgi:hypothetical protein